LKYIYCTVLCNIWYLFMAIGSPPGVNGEKICEEIVKRELHILNKQNKEDICRIEKNSAKKHKKYWNLLAEYLENNK